MGQSITPGRTWVTGETVTAAKLNDFIASAEVDSSSYQEVTGGTFNATNGDFVFVAPKDTVNLPTGPSDNDEVTVAQLSGDLDTYSVSSITRASTTATVTTSDDHNIEIGQNVAIAGADQTAYNGTVAVTGTPSTTTFTYEVSGSPTSPATGTITSSGSASVFSDTININYNNVQDTAADNTLTLDQNFFGSFKFVYNASNNVWKIV